MCPFFICFYSKQESWQVFLKGKHKSLRGGIQVGTSKETLDMAEGNCVHHWLAKSLVYPHGVLRMQRQNTKQVSFSTDDLTILPS